MSMGSMKVRLAAMLAGLGLVAGVAFIAAAELPKTKHINRGIELLEQGQPIYYTGSHSGTNGSFPSKERKTPRLSLTTLATTWSTRRLTSKACPITCRGCCAGGPTKSGHRTPAVIVNVPVNGIDEASVRANAWMFQQVLATGVHGVLLTHADSPAGVRAFIEAVKLFPDPQTGIR